MDQTQQESVISKNKRQELKKQEFREYIATHDVLLAIVKFLLAIKNAEELPENPLQTLNDYFGDYKDGSWIEFENLQAEVNQIIKENQQLQKQIEDTKQQIEETKEVKARLAEEEYLRQEEEENKKGSKKPGKK